MAGFLKRLLRRGGTEPLERGAFQRLVLDVLRQRMPDRDFRVTENPDVILGPEDSELGLPNLYANYRQSGAAGEELEDLIVAHFQRTLRNARIDKPASWAEASPELRVQLVPAEYTRQAPAPILSYPFHQGVIITVVHDMPEGYALVREEDLGRWGQSPEDVYELAVQNLDEASRNAPAQFFEGPNRCVAVQASDGYDAARILLPRFRQFLTEQLASPFYAAVPNRDFLIAWAEDCDPRFHQFAREKVLKDFGEQPYPLTAACFRVDDTGVRAWLS